MGMEVLRLLLDKEVSKAELFRHVAPERERKSPKLVFFKWKGMKSMGKRVIVPSSEEHAPDGREEAHFPRGHFSDEVSSEQT